jgi:hypothetical protein
MDRGNKKISQTSGLLVVAGKDTAGAYSRPTRLVQTCSVYNERGNCQ